MVQQDCIFCHSPGGEIIWQDDFCRVVLVDDKNYIGFCRVVLNKHVKEMTDLTTEERARLMDVTFIVERVLRELLQPEKINLANLGNKTPHIHWHVIPRFKDDAFFPGSAWSKKTQETKASTLEARRKKAQELPAAIKSVIANLS